MRHFKGKVPVLLRGDSTLLDHTNGLGLRKFFRKIILTWVYHHVDHALSPGRSADDYFKWAGLKFDQIHRAAHAIDNKRFMGGSEQTNDNQFLETKAKQWRKDLGIAPHKKVFLYAGKFETKKDPLLLIKAFASLLKKQADIHLILVGDGMLKDKLQLERSNCSDPTAITILNFQNQSIMPIVYRLADVFILPSKGPGETWGLAVNEAMACGKAVIVSDKCGCAQDLVNQGRNGFVFPSGNISLLEEAMNKTMQNDNYKEMGKESLKMIDHFSYRSFLDALQSILN